MNEAHRAAIARVRTALIGAPAGPDKVAAARSFEWLVREWERENDDTRPIQIEEVRR